MAAIIKRLQDTSFKQSLCGWAIVAMVVYLIIAQ